MESRSRRERYSRVGSMEELRTEQLRLMLEMKRKELHLLDDVEYVRNYFTYDNLSQQALLKVYKSSAIVRSAVVRYRLVRTVITSLIERFVK